MADDSALLACFASGKDPCAFAELVRRHLNLVYSAAARRVGDRELAEDVTQAVFMILAKKSSSAQRASPLSAWLLRTVRYAAANALRMERRRRRHERRAADATRTNGACSSNPSDVLIWQEVAAALDDAVLCLSALDRQAVLLRFFENRSVRDIALAQDTTEAAAGMRVNRAIEKLRQRLCRRGAALPAGAAGLTGLLTSHAVRAAPSGLLLSTSSGAGGAASLTIAKGAITMMTITKIKAAASVAALLAVLGAGAVVTLDRAGAEQMPGSPTAMPSTVQQKANARVVAAENALKFLDRRIEMNEPRTPTFVELYMVSHRRLVEAHADAKSGKEALVGAAERYLKEARKLVDVYKGLNMEPSLPFAEYWIADAEYLLAKAQLNEL